MSPRSRMALLLLASLPWLPFGHIAHAEPGGFDDTPARAGEWGFRPLEGAVSDRNPPPFSWRPQRSALSEQRSARGKQQGARSYRLQIARDPSFRDVAYEAETTFSVHCPSRVLAPGAWCWRVCAVPDSGEAASWSRVRHFTLAPGASAFPLPGRDELLARVPVSHPRLFLRPEDLPRVRGLAQGPLSGSWQALQKACARLLADPPETTEPPLYPKGTARGSDAWREIWWGNRRTTIRVLESAAALAFAWRVDGNEAYAALARRLLLEAAAWDPRGATGYRYNDEAGMPYAYHFSRAYTFLHPLLTEEERQRCRDVMRVRGGEMYRHLHPRHFWRPYGSHANRAWHFLGEVAIAFLGEIPEAGDWLWFSVHVFACVYPVWSDDDGGWHEGVNYWSSYIGRFTAWAAVMRSALDLDAYRLPYFAKVGYYPMYLLPPGTRGGGFGDLNARVRSERMRSLMTVLAAHAGNAHWQWYVDAHGGPQLPPLYYGLVSGLSSSVDAAPPTDLPTSRLFRGTGQAVLNATLLDARHNVELIFKSSPFGSHSHGYEAQNSFLLYARGRRLLIRSGYRDSYGSRHHREWMWQTKSVNSITVDGKGQTPHSADAVGAITDFFDDEHVAWVEGEAAAAYGGRLTRCRRGVLFVKPDLFVIRDCLEAKQPSTFTWHLHAPVPFGVAGQCVDVREEEAACRLRFLHPAGLVIRTSDRFDPPPRPRIRLVEHHLEASTPEPVSSVTFLTLLRVPPDGVLPAEGLAAGSVDLAAVEGGWRLRTAAAGGEATILVRRGSKGGVRSDGLGCEAALGVVLRDADGSERARFASHGAVLSVDASPR